MKNTRIRYRETSTKGVYRSVANFIGNQGAKYQVEIDTNTMTYKIRNVKQVTIVKSTEKDGKKPPTHVNTLKAQAKRALTKLGVTFSLEVRRI